PKSQAAGVGPPCWRNRWAAYSALRREMSTLLGHSVLHALHDRHRGSVFVVSSSSHLGPAPPLSFSCPVIAKPRAFPRPRVLWRSASAAWYDGPMLPPVFFLHTPAPLHISTAPSNPCWSA